MKYVSEHRSFGYIEVDEAIAQLKQWKKEYGSTLRIDSVAVEEFGDSIGYLELSYKRPYTKQEIKERATQKKIQEARERKEFERLKSKFS